MFQLMHYSKHSTEENQTKSISLDGQVQVKNTQKPLNSEDGRKNNDEDDDVVINCYLECFPNDCDNIDS
jgi:hypothetical protein